jgi:glycosyltransferase involved in cell wall biosynthesis
MKNAAGFAMESDYVIVPTNSIIEVIRDTGVSHDRVRVVPSGVDEELFANPDGRSVRKKYNIANDKIVLGTVSRLTEEKNVLFLANVIAKILKNNKDVIFIVAGEGDLTEEMMEIFEDKKVMEQIIFAGKIKRGDVKNYLDAFNVFVYASTSETQGTIVTENMYVGKPIVAIGQNGVGDLIEDDVNGISVEEDEGKFVRALQRMIDSEESRKKMGQNAKKIAKEKYTTTACAQNLLNVYDEAIEYYGNKS